MRKIILLMLLSIFLISLASAQILDCATERTYLGNNVYNLVSYSVCHWMQDGNGVWRNYTDVTELEFDDNKLKLKWYNYEYEIESYGLINGQWEELKIEEGYSITIEDRVSYYKFNIINTNENVEYLRLQIVTDTTPILTNNDIIIQNQKISFNDLNFSKFNLSIFQNNNIIYIDINASGSFYIDPTTSLAEARAMIKDDRCVGFQGCANDLIVASEGECPGEDCYEKNTYIELNFSSLNAINITNATLWLYAHRFDNDVPPATLEVTYCNDTFNESTITWANQYTEVTNCDGSPFISRTDGEWNFTGWHNFDLTTKAQAELDYDDTFSLRFDMKPDGVFPGNNFDDFYSKEESEPPYFNITYTYEINITLIQPEDTYVSSSNTLNFACNVLTYSANITNITLYGNWSGGWHANYTNDTSPYGVSESILNISRTLSNETYIWNCLAWDTYGQSGWGEANRTLTINPSIIGEEYDASVFETQQSTFKINISLEDDETLYDVRLNYNGTNYTGGTIQSIGGSNYSVSKTIDIPLLVGSGAVENKSFFWYFMIAGDAGSYLQTSPSHKQEVVRIIFIECNATYSDQTINFTIKDELTQTQITLNNSWAVDWNFWLGLGTVSKNYSKITSLTNESTFAFCISPSNLTYITNLIMEYDSDSYAPRTYYLVNSSLTNDTRYINLFLLSEDEAVKFFITVAQGYSAVTNAIVSISKYVVGSGYQQVGSRKTDSKGEFIEYLDLDKEYRFYVSKDGVYLGSVDKTATCQESPCNLLVQLGLTPTNWWQGYYDVFATNLAYNLSYDATTKLVTYDFVDLTGLAQYARLEVVLIRYNVTSITICDKSLYSPAGSIECNVSAYVGQFSATAYISRSPEKIVDIIRFAISELKEIFGAEGLLFAFFLIITVGLVGFWNPVAGIFLSVVVFFASMLFGLISISYVSVMLIVIIAIIFMIKMRS